MTSVALALAHVGAASVVAAVVGTCAFFTAFATESSFAVTDTTRNILAWFGHWRSATNSSIRASRRAFHVVFAHVPAEACVALATPILEGSMAAALGIC